MISPNYGLVTGRVSSLALDPSDASGNKLYVGTTGGGVWLATNAATASPANIVFAPLTDSLAALNSAVDASISIGAITVQPGGTGVILAGTGDPNDGLDSYYGAGILRSADFGQTWTLIAKSYDSFSGMGGQDYGFYGEGFAGFAWSTVNPQLVVAAVSQSAEGALVDAEVDGTSYKGLYYSIDSSDPDPRKTWHLALITDGNGKNVQGPNDGYDVGNGNAATSVVWNPVRGIFLAAVRFHGYYQSADGVTWTRIASQPGAGLTKVMCPTNSMIAGSPDCPIFRGVLAVNPISGDTFAWTVDENNQDQGMWQDVCARNGKVCGNPLLFGTHWSTALLETNTSLGAVTITNGDYNLALAAVPSGQDTLLLAGGNDLWKCSLAMGCAWRNTTNSATCMSAQVGPYQHALEWSGTNPQEVFVGNDSGLWRSMDAIGETGSVCDAADASHWDNLNGGLGSLAEVESMSAVGATPYTMMAGLGANGTAGVKSTAGATQSWPEILSGEGGPVAIDPTNADNPTIAHNWYVNNGAGVSIHLCSTSGPCTPADFGVSPAVTNADVGDGLTMTQAAPFLVDPLDATQLLIGTCRLWRGPASGGWTAANAVTLMLDGNQEIGSCSGNGLIRSMAAVALPGGGEVVYVGMYGSVDGGATVAGHVFSATMSGNGTWSTWQDLTLNQPTGDRNPMNVYGLGVSSLTVDPNDATGNTVYVTIAGFPESARPLSVLYRSTDGGIHWQVIDSNLPWAPANALAVDPMDANTVYVATDAGVFSTRVISTCANASCWAPLGAGLPLAPVVALSASPSGTSPGVLVAGTYGRGLWQFPLLTDVTPPTTATPSSSGLTFAPQMAGTISEAQTVTITNTGRAALFPGAVSATGDFGETDDCAQASIAAGATCSIQVVFLPTQAGARTGQLTIAANVLGGSIAVSLSGTGATAGSIQLSIAKVDFGNQQIGTQSAPFSVTVKNTGGTAVLIASVSVSGPFQLSANSCGTTSLPANLDCVLMVVFQPTANGPANGTLTMVDSAGTQSVQFVGTGTSPPNDTLSTQALNFPATIIGQNSPAQTVSITNSGSNPLTSIQISASGQFLQSNSCTTQLAAQSSCSISVQFSPLKQGPQSGSLTISDILRSQTLVLSGTGLLPPIFSVSPSSLVFAGQQVGIASAPSTLVITNAGEAFLANVGFQISGPTAGDFSVGTTTCGATLAAGAGCTVQIVFLPVAAGTVAATLTVTSSTLGVNRAVVPLSGAGQSASALGASPGTLTFAPTAIGLTSAAQTVTVTNSSGIAAAGLSVVASGPFSLTQNTCGTSLTVGANCTVGVVFSPMQRGFLSAALTIQSTSIPTATTVALHGTGGLTGGIQMQPAQVSFPMAGVGSTSSPIMVTISNSSSTVSLDSLALTVSDGFKLTANSCGTSLAAGVSCTVGVEFAPANAGAQTGSLAIASSTLEAIATVPLSGTGFDFTAALSGAASETVASGQTATYTATLTPSAGSAAAFTFQCNSLPTYAACVYNPSSNSVAANATGTETVQITTSQASASAAPAPWGVGWKAISLACGLLLLPIAMRKHRRWLTGIALLILVVTGLSSCSSSGGGGGGTPTPSPTTHTVAPGTYSVGLVVSSNSVQHSVTLTLVVD